MHKEWQLRSRFSIYPQNKVIFMDAVYKVTWNDKEIGELSDLSRDMWYIDGKWTPLQTRDAVRFEDKLKSADPKELIQNPKSALRVVLENVSTPSDKLYCLATILHEQLLTVRQVVSEEALRIFFPDRK